MKPETAKELNDFIQNRLNKFEKDVGRKFSEEFKCGFYAGMVDTFAFAQELGNEERKDGEE